MNIGSSFFASLARAAAVVALAALVKPVLAAEGVAQLQRFVASVHSAEGEVHAILEESKDRAKWFILASLPNLKAGQARTPKVTPVCRYLRIKWAAPAPAVVSAALVDAVPSRIRTEGA